MLNTFFFSFIFHFLSFSLLNLYKSLEKLARKEYFDSREDFQILIYHDICKNYDQCYILDLIYYTFQVLIFYLLYLLFHQIYQPNGKYSNLLIVTAFSNLLSGKAFSPVKNWYFPTFPDYKADIFAIFLSKPY